MSNRPYLSNREQLKGVFYTNLNRFEKVMKDIDFSKDILFQYNSNLGDEQIYSIFGQSELSENILFLIKNVGMTNFQKAKDDSHLLIYQYAPIISSDIYIGVEYDYTTEKWEYYYHHNYNSCRHNNRLIYRLYDCLFNQDGPI